MQDRKAENDWAFYRVILALFFGVVLVMTGNSILIGAGVGVLALSVILHISTMGKWIREDLTKAILESKEVKKE